MLTVRTSLLALAATILLYGTAQAQPSNPVTSDPPLSAIGRDSETSPGTPNRQNSAPGYRGRYDAPYYGPSYGGYGGYGTPYEEPAIIVTPSYVEVD